MVDTHTIQRIAQGLMKTGIPSDACECMMMFRNLGTYKHPALLFVRRELMPSREGRRRVIGTTYRSYVYDGDDYPPEFCA